MRVKGQEIKMIQGIGETVGAEPHCQWALDVAFNTGCRPGETELFKLKFTDVDWEKGTLLIRGTKTGPR